MAVVNVKDKVAVNPHRVVAAVRLAQAVLRAQAAPSRRVVQGAVVRHQVHSTVPAGVADKHQ